MLHIVLWQWSQPGFRETYTAKHVNMVVKQIERFVTIPHRVVAIAEHGEGINGPCVVHPLWKDHYDLANATGKHLPTCYRRLKLFDQATQEALGIKEGDRIASLDLDSIIIQNLDTMFQKMDESNTIFCGWGVPGTYHEMVFNGSFWSFKAGSALQWVWSQFKPQSSPRETLTMGFMGSDQSWLSRSFCKRNDVLPIRYPEFASYPREIRRLGRIDYRTKIVFFHGARKPWHQLERRQHPWIAQHWPLETPHGR